MKPLNYKDGSWDKTHDILPKLKSKGNPPEAMNLTIANSNLGCLNEASFDDPEYLCLHHQKMKAKWLSTWNVRACRGNLTHNISLKTWIKRNILTSFQTHSTQLNLRIRYSTRGSDTKLQRYDTRLYEAPINSRYSTYDTQLLILNWTHFDIK